MSAVDSRVATRKAMDPEIEAALAAIDLPEVQAIIRRLSRHHLAVCIPHMHLPAQDFAVLPRGMLQIERRCVVTWAARADLHDPARMVPVAWRWEDDGVAASATCWSYCAKTPDGHDRVHDKVD